MAMRLLYEKLDRLRWGNTFDDHRLVFWNGKRPLLLMMEVSSSLLDVPAAHCLVYPTVLQFPPYPNACPPRAEASNTAYLSLRVVKREVVDASNEGVDLFCLPTLVRLGPQTPSFPRPPHAAPFSIESSSS